MKITSVYNTCNILIKVLFQDQFKQAFHTLLKIQKTLQKQGYWKKALTLTPRGLVEEDQQGLKTANIPMIISKL